MRKLETGHPCPRDRPLFSEHSAMKTGEKLIGTAFDRIKFT